MGVRKGVLHKEIKKNISIRSFFLFDGHKICEGRAGWATAIQLLQIIVLRGQSISCPLSSFYRQGRRNGQPSHVVIRDGCLRGWGSELESGRRLLFRGKRCERGRRRWKDASRTVRRHWNILSLFLWRFPTLLHILLKSRRRMLTFNQAIDS